MLLVLEIPYRCHCAILTFPFFVFSGARINKRDYDSCTPLLLASIKGHVETIEVLMEAFADHTAVDILEKTAVYLAVEENHLEALKVRNEWIKVKIFDSWNIETIMSHFSVIKKCC